MGLLHEYRGALGRSRVGEIIDAGNDKVVTNQHARMRGKSSGAEVTWSYWHVFTFRHGKVLRAPSGSPTEQRHSQPQGCAE